MGRAEAFPGNCALFPGLPFLWSPWLSTPKTADEPLPTVGLERDTDTSWRVGSQHLGKGIMTLWRPAFHPQPLVHKTAGRRLGRGSRGPPSPSPPPVPPAEKSAGSAQGWLQSRALFQPTTAQTSAHQQVNLGWIRPSAKSSRLDPGQERNAAERMVQGGGAP